MKISVNFSELQSVLGYSNTILSDKSVDDKLRNVIFMVNSTEETVKVISYNAYTFSRTELEKATVEDCSSDWEFQVKASDLNKIVSSFSSMYRTEVNTVDFEDDGVKIKLTVHEEPKEGNDERLAQDSMFQLENAPILKNINNDIHMEFPENDELLQSGDLLLYLDSLFPLLSNDSASSYGSKINFAEDYIFVLTSTMSAFMQNKLPDAFKGITITYSSVNFLKKLCENVEDLGVAKLDKYICIKSGLTEAFMKFQLIKPNYKMYIDKKDTSNGVVLDRLYFKDVLKRMGNTSPDGKIFITDGQELRVENESFQQVIPINNSKGEVEGIGFNISVPIMEKIIVGRDDVFKEDIFLYLVKTPRGYIIYLSDKTGSWFANTQVTRV